MWRDWVLPYLVAMVIVAVFGLVGMSVSGCVMGRQIMMIDLETLNAAAALTLAGAIFIAYLLGMWLKKFLTDWRFTPLAVLGGTLLVMGLLALVVPGATAPDQLARILLLGFVGATMETFGYEVVTNIAGRYGVGNRSDTALQMQALDLIHAAGYEVRPLRK